MRRLLIAVLAIAAFVVFALFAFVPNLVDRRLNRVESLARQPAISQSTRALHSSLFIADLHADPLLWQRNLLDEINHGHVDIPRLIRGGVALQVFAAPTQVPAGLNYQSNELDLDVVTALAVTQRWPRSTWQSPFARAVHMAQTLRRVAERSNGRFRIVQSAGDLADFVRDHSNQREQVAALLAIEGLHAIEGRIEYVDGLFDAGYRMMGLTHFFDNELGGSAHGVSKAGLSEFGRTVVSRMQQRNILIDLAHASPRMIDDVLAMATTPVVVSHTGVRGTCDNIRNLSDDHLRGIAATGGVIGIGYWDAAICDVDVDGILRAIAYTVRLAGIDHVGLGSDFDGATTTPFDTAGLAQITQGLVDAGFSADDIGKIMGANVRRVLARALPAAIAE